MDEVKRETGGVVPTIISQAAWTAAMLIDSEVTSMLGEAGFTRKEGVSKSMTTMAKVVQHAINRELDAAESRRKPAAPSVFQALDEKARKAAHEICVFFDVRQARGVRYQNTIEDTIAIIIAQNMRGEGRLKEVKDGR